MITVGLANVGSCIVVKPTMLVVLVGPHTLYVTIEVTDSSLAPLFKSPILPFEVPICLKSASVGTNPNGKPATGIAVAIPSRYTQFPVKLKARLPDTDATEPSISYSPVGITPICVNPLESKLKVARYVPIINRHL